jgi:hypothetical protein
MRIWNEGAVRVTNKLQEAVLRTVLYADIFSYPLTPREVHHFLIECEATEDEVLGELEGLCRNGALTSEGEWVALAERSELFALRRRRADHSARLWPLAEQWAGRLAQLPFVRMIAVTGALAVDNVDAREDIDYLIVTEPGRLWLCRALVIGLVYAAGRRGVQLCPNYLISTRRLQMRPHTLFTAHDLTQMVPLFGEAAYAELWQLNPWWQQFLPQASGPLRRPLFYCLTPWQAAWKQGAERALIGAVGNRMEQWEFERKRQKFLRQASQINHADPLAFDPDACKGHFEGHGTRTLDAYQERLQAYGLLTEQEHAYWH